MEMNVRKTVFTPEKTGINYITLRGSLCATPPRTGAAHRRADRAGHGVLVQGLDY